MKRKQKLRPKSNIKFQNHVLLTRSDFFPSETLSPAEYLIGIPKIILIQYAAKFLLHYDHQSNDETPEQFLEKYFANYSDRTYIEWIKIIQSKRTSYGTSVAIVYPISCYKFFEYALRQDGNIEPDFDKSFIERSNINILKCFLAINEEFRNKELSAFEGLQRDHPENASILISFLGSMMESDMTKFVPSISFITQLAKSRYLFAFLLGDKEARKLLSLYLSEIGLTSANDYFAKLAFLLQESQKRDPITGMAAFTLDEHQFPKLSRFVKHILATDVSDEPDFLSIRNNPIVELRPSTYHIVHDKFLFDKLYMGLFFGLNSTYKNKKLNFLNDFMGYFGESFFEQHLCYKILENTLSGNAIRLSGLDIKYKRQQTGNKRDGEPDYYIRNWDNIFLFEIKNNLIRSSIKYSFDFENIESHLKTRFIYDPKGKKDGIVKQISNNIDLILSGDLDYDDISQPARNWIYPVAILPEETYSSYGLNFLANTWFRDELDGRAGDNNDKYRKVKPLVIITIDTLLIANHLIKQKKGTMKQLLDGYINNHMKINNKNNQRISFSMYVYNFSRSSNIDYSLAQVEADVNFDVRLDDMASE
ncbi:hypothetical protein [Dyadobacter sp. 22481]|uniref:hypothetical protein n=1 Tax=Dyadobacter sp. 22481 TaxID=3453926 RepID=UPI003F853F7C